MAEIKPLDSDVSVINQIPFSRRTTHNSPWRRHRHKHVGLGPARVKKRVSDGQCKAKRIKDEGDEQETKKLQGRKKIALDSGETALGRSYRRQAFEGANATDNTSTPEPIADDTLI